MLSILKSTKIPVMPGTRIKLNVERRDLEEYEQYLAKTLGLGC